MQGPDISLASREVHNGYLYLRILWRYTNAVIIIIINLIKGLMPQ